MTYFPKSNNKFPFCKSTKMKPKRPFAIISEISGLCVCLNLSSNKDKYGYSIEIERKNLKGYAQTNWMSIIPTEAFPLKMTKVEIDADKMCHLILKALKNNELMLKTYMVKNKLIVFDNNLFAHRKELLSKSIDFVQKHKSILV